MAEKSERLKKLEQQQERLRLAIQRERHKLAGQERRDDTRRKILVGALILAEAEQDLAMKTRLDALLRKHLTRNDDRALFGLDPLPGNRNDTAKDEQEAA